MVTLSSFYTPSLLPTRQLHSWTWWIAFYFEYLESFVSGYQDNILVYITHKDQHLKHLRCVLGKLCNPKRYEKLSNFEFKKMTVEYIRNNMIAEGISFEVQKFDAMLSWRTLKNKTDVQAFLRLVNDYKRLFKNYYAIPKPLTKVEWSEEQLESFEALKKCVNTTPVLRHFDPKLPTLTSTGTSEHAIGAVVEHFENNGKWLVGFS